MFAPKDASYDNDSFILFMFIIQKMLQLFYLAMFDKIVAIYFLKHYISYTGGVEMNFEKDWMSLFADLNIPEIFITDYLPNANGDYVKIYLYCLFLCHHESNITPLDLSKKLSMPIATVEQALAYWEEHLLLTKKQNGYLLNDVKQQELLKQYSPKVTSSPEEAIQNTANNVKRTQAINAINSIFFQGVMSPTWFTDIDTLFAKYKFEEDVVIALFQYCFDRQALHRNYLFAVAEGWHKSGIITMEDVDNYYAEFEKVNQLKKAIAKKLGIKRNLSEYEEAYINKWLGDYHYQMNIIEIALKKTTSKTNPSFDYIDKILTDWHERKLDTPEKIEEFLKSQKEKQKEFKQLDFLSIQNSKNIQKYTDTSSKQFSDLSQFYAN